MLICTCATPYAEPVYFAVYVEAVDEFFAVDIKQLVDENWGDSVFKDETFVKKAGEPRPDTVSIKIPKTAIVNEQFWERLLKHRSMRIDGVSYRGVPLPHTHDIPRRECVLSASCCFQFALSAIGWFQSHLEANFAHLKNRAFRSLSGQLMLPVAAN